MAHKVDRTNWPAGEWDNEPDRVDFVAQGFACMMVRAQGHWCGYVGVPNTHICYGVDVMDWDNPHMNTLSVHGGITYTSKCSGEVCHVPEPGMPHDVWWIGFDCHHHNDMSPAMVGFGFNNGGAYRNVEYVRAETILLAEQLDRIKDI